MNCQNWFSSHAATFALVAISLFIAGNCHAFDNDITFTYIGQLSQKGIPYSGSADVTFTLWDARNGGSTVAATQRMKNITIKEGMFKLPLSFNDEVFAKNKTRWLEVSVRAPSGKGSFTTLSPRREVARSGSFNSGNNNNNQLNNDNENIQLMAPDFFFSAPNSIYLNIDADNNSTDAVLEIAKHRTRDTGGVSLFKVQEDGKVGIGTTTPSYNLEVRGGVNGNLGYFSNENNLSSGNTYGIFAKGDAYDTITGYGRGGYFYGKGGSTSGDAWGISNRAYAYGTSTAYGVYSDAIGGSTTGREYAFYGRGDGYFSGNVGIGITTPNYALEVAGNVSGNLGYFYNDNDSSGDANGIYARGNAYDTGTGEGRGGYFFGRGGSTNGSAYGTRNYANAYGSSNAYGVWSDATLGSTTGMEYAFYGRGDGYFSGNVGIGTMIPSYKLEVTGHISAFNGYFSGNVGVGTSNPSYKLEVTGDISGYNGYFSQNVGIGAAPGTEKLIVSGGGGSWADGFLALKNTNEDAGIRIYDSSSTVRYSFYNDNSAGDILRITPQDNYGSGIVIDQNGNVGIGTSPPNYRLEVVGFRDRGAITKFINTSTSINADGIGIQIGPNSNPQGGNRFLTLLDGNGSTIGWVDGNGAGGVNYQSASDARLKTNIAAFGGGLDMVSRMKVRKYEFISAPGNERIGFLAQELQTVFPQAVSGDPEGDVEERPMGVDYGRVTPVLVSAIQELNAKVQQKDLQITELQTRLTTLEAMVERENKELRTQNLQLESRLTQLEAMMVQLLNTQKDEE